MQMQMKPNKQNEKVRECGFCAQHKPKHIFQHAFLKNPFLLMRRAFHIQQSSIRMQCIALYVVCAPANQKGSQRNQKLRETEARSHLRTLCCADLSLFPSSFHLS